MSGCSYSCQAYPAEGHFDFVPNASQLAAVISGLAAAGWIDASGRVWEGVAATESGGFKKVPLVLEELSQGLVDLAGSGTFTIELENGRDCPDPTPFERDPEGVFRPEHCQDAYVVTSGVPLVVEDPLGTDECACEACHQNVLMDRGEHPDARIREALLFPPCYAPEKCPHCGVRLELSRLSMPLMSITDSPSPRIETAPFFRFGVWLLPSEKCYPDTDLVLVDPSLVVLLERACGVPFRTVGTLCCS